MGTYTTYTLRQLEEALKLVEGARASDQLRPQQWARCAKILAAEVETLQNALYTAPHPPELLPAGVYAEKCKEWFFEKVNPLLRFRGLMSKGR